MCRGQQQRPPPALPAFRWAGACQHASTPAQVSTQGLSAGAGGVAQRHPVLAAGSTAACCFHGKPERLRTHPRGVETALTVPEMLDPARNAGSCRKCWIVAILNLSGKAKREEPSTCPAQHPVPRAPCRRAAPHAGQEAAARALFSEGRLVCGCCSELRARVLGEASLALAPALAPPARLPLPRRLHSAGGTCPARSQGAAPRF